MKNLSKLLAITIFLVFGLFTAITSFPNQLDAAPPGNPPLANVSPRFTELRVDNNTWLYDTVTLGNSIDDYVFIAGKIKGSALGYNKVYVDDDLDITKDLKVTQNLTVDGNTTLGNASTDTVTIPGTTTISNRLNIGSNTTSVDHTSLQIYGKTSILGTTDFTGPETYLRNWVQVMGDLRVDGLLRTKTIQNSYNTDGVKITDKLSVTNNLSTSGNLSVSGTTTSTGHLKASSIGKFVIKNCWTVANGTTAGNNNHCYSTDKGPAAAWGKVPANSWGALNGFCDTGYIAIGCFGGFLDPRDSSSQWINALTTTTNLGRYGCYLNVQNNMAGIANIMLYVSCFNPNAGP